MKTILVIGASGFIGSNVVHHFKKKNYRVIAAFNKNIIRYPGVSTFCYNFNAREALKRALSLFKPDIIIYCAGMTDFLECAKHPRMAETANSIGPVVLSGAAESLPHRFIYLSTCFVYDGSKGNFSENDVILAETVFGKSKTAGENYVRSKSLTHTILRFPPIYGLGSIYHISEFDRIRMRLERGLTVELAENEYHAFLSIDIALKAIEWVATLETKNRTYNLGGLTKLSWYEFGLRVAESFGFNQSLVIPTKGQFESIVDFSLNGSELIKQLDINPLVLEEGLDLLKKQLIC